MKRFLGLMLALAFVFALAGTTFAGPILPGGSWEEQVVKPRSGSGAVVPCGPILPGGSWEEN